MFLINILFFIIKVCGIQKAVYICNRVTKEVSLKFIENIEIDSVKLCLHNLELSKTHFEYNSISNSSC